MEMATLPASIVTFAAHVPIVCALRNFWRSPWRRLGAWCARAVRASGYLASVLWLCVYPLLAFLLGVAMLGFVDQTREFYAQFGSPGAFAGVRTSQAFLFALSLLLWAIALWYAMRILLGQTYPGDPPVARELTRFAEGLRTWLPRVFGYLGLLIAACMLATYAPGKPDTSNLAALCALHVASHVLVMAWIRGPVAFTPPIAAALSSAGLAAGTASDGFGAVSIAMLPVISVLAIIGVVGSTVVHRRGWFIVCMTGAVLLAFADFAVRVGPDRRLLAALLVLVASGFFAMTIVRRRWIGRHSVAAGAQPELPALRAGLPAATRYVMGASSACFIAFIIGFYVIPHTLGEVFGSLAIVFIGLTLWMVVGVLVFVHVPKRFGLPSLAVLPMVFVSLISSYADNHALYGTAFRNGPDQRSDLVADFKRWQAARIAEGDAPDAPVLFVAAAGGGLRAAHWTARVLAAIDDASCDAFGRRVYAISGVSGGSLGAATYAALKADRLAGAADPTKVCSSQTGAGSLSRSVEHVLGRDFLAPVIGSFLFTDAFQRWIPAPIVVRDRGWVLAEHWAQAWQEAQGTDRMHAPLAALYAQDRDRRLPMLFLNATSVDSGRRAVASGVQLTVPTAIDVYAAGYKTDGLSLAQAVLNSARFAYVSPAGTLLGRLGEQVGVADRLVDGGYFDNSGAETLLDVIGTLEDSGALQKGRSYAVLISNEATQPRLCQGNNPEPIEGSMGALIAHTPNSSETLAPIEAMLSTRIARAWLAMDRVARKVGCDHVIELGMYADQYPSALQDDTREPALGWFLSRSSVRLIDLLAAQYAGKTSISTTSN